LALNPVLHAPSIAQKLEQVENCIHHLLCRPTPERVPELPGRDITYLPISFLQGRMGLSTREGQQKLIHDLANIELQAMELGVRTLCEFPNAPMDFREALGQIVLEEAKHLRLCLEGLESLGGYWGQWPVHLGLWHATHAKDSLLERVFIVHRYLEGSGLDAGDTLLRRLSSVPSPVVKQVVETIVNEEVGHVAFGSRWYRQLCEQQSVDEALFFTRLCFELKNRHPRKDKISETLRHKAQFNEFEIRTLKEFRL
jgi:uncharacterized ferritin-like protein (DUF455 family)